MIFVRIFLIKYNFYLCQLITIYVLLYIMFIRNVGCLFHIKIMNFSLDEIVKLSNKINRILIKRLENSLSLAGTLPQSLVNLISTRVLRNLDLSPRGKEKASKIFHSACLEIYSIFRVAANFLASISSRKGNSPIPPNSANVSHGNV